MIRVRKAGQADAGTIASISRQTFLEAFAAVNTPANMEKFMREQFSTEQLLAEVEDPANIFYLACDGDTVSGYVKLREGEKQEEFGGLSSMEIARIYCTQEMTGKGVGNALMQQCIETANDSEKKILWLGVWEHNHRAIRFYEKWGFTPFGTHVFMLGDDAQTDWLMKKLL